MVVDGVGGPDDPIFKPGVGIAITVGTPPVVVNGVTVLVAVVTSAAGIDV